MRSPAALLLLALSGAGTAQTFVVDASNGPGTHFTSIFEAVANVPDGATIRVRAGVYIGFNIQGKGLAILAEPGTFISPNSGPMYIGQTTASQTVVVSGLTSNHLGFSMIVGCDGPVQIENWTSDFLSQQASTPQSWLVSGCRQVLFRDCSQWSCTLNSSNVVFERCRVMGADAAPLPNGDMTTSSLGLVVWGGATQLVDCTVHGGRGGLPSSPFYPPQPNQPAIFAGGADLRILGDSRIEAASCSCPLTLVPAIVGSGALRIAPTAVVTSAATPTIAPGVVTAVVRAPTVRSSSGDPGGSVQANATGPAHALLALFVGLPGPPLFVPGIQDPLWLDPVTRIPVALGGPRLVVTVPVPAGSGWVGRRIGFQCAGATTAGLELSNPTVALVH